MTIVKPHSMHALVLDIYGGPFRLVEMARPAFGDGQVLVRIKASGVNPLDTKIRSGTAAHAKQPLPAILGIDLAGVVEAVGPDVTGMKLPAASCGVSQNSISQTSRKQRRIP